MSIFDESTIPKQKQAKKISSPAVLDEVNVIESRSTSAQKRKVKSSFASISPVVDVTNNDFFEMRNGEYLEILQIETKDIYSLNESDLQNEITNLTLFFTAYNDHFKIVALNVPLNLEQQKRYFYQKLKANKNPAYTPFLEKRLLEFENLEQIRTSRAYFLFVYADEEKKLLEKIHQLRALLSRSNPLSVLTIENKTNILFQLFNPNTKPLIE